MNRNSFRCLVIVIGLVALAVLAACGSTQPTQAPPASQSTAAVTVGPALDGATLLETRCSSCHGADRAKQAKKTQAQWDQTVSRMVGKGAKLTDAEKAALVEYLAKTYGP